VWSAMASLFLVGVSVIHWAEARGNPLFPTGVDQRVSALQAGGNMEGKEVRFGIANTVLWAAVTTDASCGAINGWHDSFTPLGGMVPLVNIMLSEVIFGGVGACMYGMLIYIILAVFIAGLMVGRTPEYLGKKIEAFDVKMAMLSVLFSSLTILVFAAVRLVASLGPPTSPTPVLMGSPRFFTRTPPPREITARRLAASTRIRSGTTPARLLPCCWEDSLS